MSEAASMLRNYLRETGMSTPADAAQQFQVTLLYQWAEHLEAVLAGEGVDRATALRVIRGMIYGGVPGVAEAELRRQITEEQLNVLEGTARPMPWRKV